jgi:hypothetical protein
MKIGHLLGVGIAFGLMWLGLLRADPESATVTERLARAKVEAARRTYEVIWQNNKEGFVPFVELAYRWSRRWLEAEVAVHTKKPQQLAAYQAHGDRMRELARITRERYRNHITTIDEVSATDFYRAEADLWLEQAKQEQP